MSETEPHFTVFIRLPFPRGDFIDPPPVAWSAAKERQLWEALSRASKGNEIDWGRLSEQLEVTQTFLLQQAAWLYERQLSQVRAQMKKMAPKAAAIPSSTASSNQTSVINTQTMKATGGGTSRAPSRLSLQANTASTDKSTPATPVTPTASRAPIPSRTTSTTNMQQHQRTDSSQSSRPLSKRSPKEGESTSRTQSIRGNVQNSVQRSPKPAHLAPAQANSSSDDEVIMTRSRLLHRRPNSAALRRGNPSARRPSIVPQFDEDDEDDAPAFLPFSTAPANTVEPGPITSQATSKPTVKETSLVRPLIQQRTTSERIVPVQKQSVGLETTVQLQSGKQLTSSTSSDSNGVPAATPRQPNPPPLQPLRTSLPQALSPQQQAALATAAGLSPRLRRAAGNNGQGSDTSPSMGSSFSDLEDASVTQSALEEALLSGMGNTTMTMAGPSSVASRVSGISHALKSKYFDARSDNNG